MVLERSPATPHVAGLLYYVHLPCAPDDFDVTPPRDGPRVPAAQEPGPGAVVRLVVRARAHLLSRGDGGAVHRRAVVPRWRGIPAPAVRAPWLQRCRRAAAARSHVSGMGPEPLLLCHSQRDEAIERAARPPLCFGARARR